jgi:anthranilate phosphoribosyltransferase
VKRDKVKTYEIGPQDVGLPLARSEDLKGGDAAANAATIRAVLAGEGGPRRDIVLLNAAAAIVAGQKARTLQDGVAAAARAIDSGAAREKLDHLVALTKSA